MTEFRCSKCGSINLEIEVKSNNTGLYCCDCGKWIKWLNPEEIRIFNHQNNISENVSGIEFTDRECELLITLLSSEIMKMHLNYGNKEPKRLQELYGIRDKIVNRKDG